MRSKADLAFDLLLRKLYVELKSAGFKKSGQRFARQTEDVWQVIGVQRSRFAASNEKILTLNFGIAPKTVLEFRGKDVSKAPLDFTCSLQGRISSIPPSAQDKWWTVIDEDSANAAASEIGGLIQTKILPFLDQLRTNASILSLYDSGQIYGWEVEANEARMIVSVAEDKITEVNRLLMDYAERWLSSGASQRAQSFMHALTKKIKV